MRSTNGLIVTLRASALGVALAAAACGGAEDQLDPTPTFFPIAVGNRWVYSVKNVVTGEVLGQKIVLINAREPVGGTGPNAQVVAFRRTTTAPHGRGATSGWWGVIERPDGRLIVNYREIDGSNDGQEEWWQPYHLKLDETRAHLRAGVQWTESNTKLDSVDRSMHEIWKVGETRARITVPAGTFECLEIIHSSPAGRDKHTWYARGVGKVREVGGDIEELTEYHIESPAPN